MRNVITPQTHLSVGKYTSTHTVGSNAFTKVWVISLNDRTRNAGHMGKMDKKGEMGQCQKDKA